MDGIVSRKSSERAHAGVKSLPTSFDQTRMEFVADKTSGSKSKSGEES